MAGTVPHTEEKIPYNSLMDALGRATPAMLTEAEKAGLPVPVPAIRSPRTMASPKRLPWRGLLAVSALVITAGLSAYVLLSRGGKDAAQARPDKPRLRPMRAEIGWTSPCRRGGQRRFGASKAPPVASRAAPQIDVLTARSAPARPLNKASYAQPRDELTWSSTPRCRVSSKLCRNLKSALGNYSTAGMLRLMTSENIRQCFLSRGNSRLSIRPCYANQKAHYGPMKMGVSFATRMKLKTFQSHCRKRRKWCS